MLSNIDLFLVQTMATLLLNKKIVGVCISDVLERAIITYIARITLYVFFYLVIRR